MKEGHFTVLWWLKLFCVLAVFQLAWVPTSQQLSWIRQSALALSLAYSRVTGFLRHSSVWFCLFGCVFQYTLGLEVLACSIDTNFNYVIVIFQLCTSFTLSIIMSFQQCLEFEREKIGKRLLNQVVYYALLSILSRLSIM